MSKAKLPPMMRLPDSSPTMVERMTVAIDGLAIHLARIPDYPLPPALKTRLRIIVDELTRRAQ